MKQRKPRSIQTPYNRVRPPYPVHVPDKTGGFYISPLCLTMPDYLPSFKSIFPPNLLMTNNLSHRFAASKRSAPKNLFLEIFVRLIE